MDETARGHKHGRFSCGGVTRHTTFIGSFVGVLIIKALKSYTMHHVSCNGRACDPRCSCLLAVYARNGCAVRRRCRAAEGGGGLGCNRQMTALPDHGSAQGSARTDLGLVWMREEAPAASYGLCSVFSPAVIDAGSALSASSHVFERPTAVRIQARGNPPGDPVRYRVPDRSGAGLASGTGARADLPRVAGAGGDGRLAECVDHGGAGRGVIQGADM